MLHVDATEAIHYDNTCLQHGVPVDVNKHHVSALIKNDPLTRTETTNKTHEITRSQGASCFPI